MPVTARYTWRCRDCQAEAALAVPGVAVYFITGAVEGGSMQENGYVLLGSRGLVTVGGTDRVTFLQGLISNDIRRVAPDRAIWAALLTPQGKYLHDFFISEIDGIFFLDCERERLMDLGQRLSRYKLRAKIDLGIAQGHIVAVLPGKAALGRAGLPAEPGAARAVSGGVLYVDPRLAEAGGRAVLPKAGGEAALRELGFVPGDFIDYERLRLACGLPDGSRDLVVEKAILLESNFDELHGVDWNKGCYMGQELTARTKYRGLVKKRLLPVDIAGAAPPPGTQVLLDGKDAGEMRSAADGKGLALLRLEQLERAMRGDGVLKAGDATLTARKPDWAAF
jgi:folate-binding protein YgfZ